MKNSIKKQIRKLWECCFGDSPKFIDLYFNKRYTHERNLVITKDEKVVSALQLLPYPLKVYNQIVDTLYISGAATFPEYRNQGSNETAYTKVIPPYAKPIYSYIYTYSCGALAV